jgi:uncharacterized protein (DUF1330 family)
MPKGYWIARNDVHDPEAYKLYVAANIEAFTKYGGKFLVRGGQFKLAEGVTRPRHIVIEFPDYVTALACYESAEYRKAAEIRGRASEGDLVIIEGVS